jgi:predicted AlkP superfamily pyrophosphatase or phosphodiesterase
MSLKPIFILFLTISLSSHSYDSYGQKKVVFIILDGIPADVLELANTPYLDEIAKVGGYSRAYTGGIAGGYSETPTISAVGYNSLLTGTWANKHNVWGNEIENPNYQYWTIFRHLKAARPASTIAVFSTWEDNRTKLIGEGIEEAGNLKMDFAFDGFELDTLTYPHDSEKNYIQQIDNLVSYEAAYRLKTNSPDLSWIYLEYTDDMGHQFGDSPQLFAAVELADQQVGRIYESIRYREEKFGEDWLIIVTTDHGRKAEDGKDHGGQSDREREIWMVTNAKHLNDYFKKQNPAMVDIFPTIARFLHVEIQTAALRELDGVPMIGQISIAQVKAETQGEEVILSWLPMESAGRVMISYAEKDQFKEMGIADNYLEIGETELVSGEFRILRKDLPKGKLKFWIQGKKNGAGVWLFLSQL